jgi:hypothetical protein
LKSDGEREGDRIGGLERVAGAGDVQWMDRR